MADPNKTVDQNLLPVQAYFAVDGTFQTFIGQGQPFTVPISGPQSNLQITNSTLDSSPIGATTPSTGVFTNISTTTGTITTTPSSSTDIANKYYVDNVAQGLGPKAACQVGTTANITLSGLQTIDSYTTLSGDRVLVKNQGTSSENGIYIASASAWTRAVDMDVWSEVSGAYTVVLNGGQADTGWVCTASKTGTIGVTAMPWVQFSGSATYFAGTGLSLASNTFSITNTGVTAASYGSASQTVTFVINAQGQITSATSQNIAIAATQITSGTIDSARISGSYTGITGVGTITAGTWNGTTISVANGGTGAITLTGYVKGNGTSAFTANATIPNTDITGLGTMSTQNANSVAITGGSATLSTLITSGLTGYLYGNGSSAVSASTTIPTSALSGSFVSTFSAGTTGLTPSTGTTGAVTLAGTLNVANGGTGVTASSGANSVVLRDSNSNVTANSFTPAWTSTTTTAGTTTLTVANTYYQRFVGSTTQTVKLPDATTVSKGQGFIIDNDSSGSLSLQDGSAASLGSVVPGMAAFVFCEDNGTTAGSWSGYLFVPGGGPSGQVTWGTSGLSMGGQTISNSTWNGSVVGLAYGGTNANLSAVAGGVVYSAASALAISAAGTTGQVLTSAGSGAPTWSTPTAYATVTDDTTTNATRYPLFANQTSGNLSTEYTSSTKLQFNPSTGVFTATQFSGSGAGLTSIPNSALNNSSVTVGSTAISLGGTATTIAGLTSVTSTTFVGALTGNASTATTATTATNATNIAITDNTSTNAVYYPVFVSNSSGNNAATTSSTKLKYNPSTGALYVSAIYIAP